MREVCVWEHRVIINTAQFVKSTSLQTEPQQKKYKKVTITVYLVVHEKIM